MGFVGEAIPGLIERNGNDFMTAQIADVADFNSKVVARLPLNIEGLVHSVWQFVGAIVDAEGKQG